MTKQRARVHQKEACSTGPFRGRIFQQVVGNTKGVTSISTRIAMGVGMPMLALLVQRLRRRRGRHGTVVLAIVHGLSRAGVGILLLIIALAILPVSGAWSWTKTARARTGVIALHKLDLLVTI